MAGGGMSFSFPSLLFHEGRTYGQPEVVPISLPQVATGALVNKFWTRNIKKYSVTLYGCIRHTPPLTSLQETLGR